MKPARTIYIKHSGSLTAKKVFDMISENTTRTEEYEQSKKKEMTSAKIIIRKQFNKGEFDEIMDCLNTSIEPSLVTAMIEFAKLHVTAALKQASEKATLIKTEDVIINDVTMYIKHVDKKSILNSYSLDNIK